MSGKFFGSGKDLAKKRGPTRTKPALYRPRVDGSNDCPAKKSVQGRLRSGWHLLLGQVLDTWLTRLFLKRRLEILPSASPENANFGQPLTTLDNTLQVRKSNFAQPRTTMYKSLISWGLRMKRHPNRRFFCEESIR